MYVIEGKSSESPAQSDTSVFHRYETRSAGLLRRQALAKYQEFLHQEPTFDVKTALQPQEDRQQRDSHSFG